MSNILKPTFKYLYSLFMLCMVFLNVCINHSALANQPLSTQYDGSFTQKNNEILIDNDTLWANSFIFVDESEQLTIDAILAKQPTFKKPSTSYSALGISDKPVWIKIKPKNVSIAKNQLAIFEVDYPTINILDIYHVQHGEVIRSIKVGTKRPFANRIFRERNYAMPIRLAQHKNDTIYLKVASENVLILPLTIKTVKQYFSDLQSELILQGVINGLMLMLLIYCGLKFYASERIIYLKFAGIIFSYILLNLYHLGIGQQFLWTNNDWVESKVAGIATFLMVIFWLLFTEETLINKSKNKKISVVLLTLSGINAVFLLLFLFNIFSEEIRHQILFHSTWMYLAFIPIYMYFLIKRSVLGFYLTLALLVQVVSFSVITLVVLGKMPSNFWTLHAIQFFTIIDCALFLLTMFFFLKKEELKKNEMLQRSESLKQLVIQDELTGVLNRRGILDAIEKLATAQPIQNNFAVYYIDLNDFKVVNDRHGHDTGDALLQHIANRLNTLLIKETLVGRMGGDEFVLLAKHVSTESEAFNIKQTIENLCNAPVNINNIRINATISIGYAIYPNDTDDSRELLILADTAMYKEKNLQKNDHFVRQWQ